MSRLWDTPEFWVRSEADEMLRDYPVTDVATLVATMEQSSANYDGDPIFRRNLVTELRHRAAAGVRFWPEHKGLAHIEFEARAVMMDSATTAWQAIADFQDPDEVEVPSQWWQRW